MNMTVNPHWLTNCEIAVANTPALKHLKGSSFFNRIIINLVEGWGDLGTEDVIRSYQNRIENELQNPPGMLTCTSVARARALFQPQTPLHPVLYLRSLIASNLPVLHAYLKDVSESVTDVTILQADYPYSGIIVRVNGAFQSDYYVHVDGVVCLASGVYLKDNQVGVLEEVNLAGYTEYTKLALNTLNKYSVLAATSTKLAHISNPLNETDKVRLENMYLFLRNTALGQNAQAQLTKQNEHITFMYEGESYSLSPRTFIQMSSYNLLFTRTEVRSLMKRAIEQTLPRDLQQHTLPKELAKIIENCYVQCLDARKTFNKEN